MAAACSNRESWFTGPVEMGSGRRTFKVMPAIGLLTQLRLYRRPGQPRMSGGMVLVLEGPHKPRPLHRRGQFRTSLETGPCEEAELNTSKHGGATVVNPELRQGGWLVIAPPRSNLPSKLAA